ncbi:MAG TPA: hypothetical protein VFS21_31835 [Roseiflexaceae bacterium]|nr:hypothetical protein [Roseiflexaceae bacterium]
MPTKHHQSQPLPAALPPAPLAPLAWSDIVRPMLEQSTLQGIKSGVLLGAVYAAAAAAFLLSEPLPVFGLSLSFIASFLMKLPMALLIVGPVGGTVGAVAGAILGLLNGLLVATLSRLFFARLDRWQLYRFSVGLLCTGLATGLFLLSGLALDLIYLGFFTPIVLWAAPVGGLAFWHISGRLAAWYAKQAGVYNLPVLLCDSDPLYHYDQRTQHLLLDTSPHHYRRALRALSLGQDARQRLLELVDLAPDMRVCDLLAGNRDLWPAILELIGPAGRLVVVGPQTAQHIDPQIELVAGDALSTGLPDGSIDALLCSFRAALVPPEQLSALVESIDRALGPNGIVGLVDFSYPQDHLGQTIRRSYLHTVAPLLSLAQLTRPRYTDLVAKQTLLLSGHALLARGLEARGFEIHCYQVPGSGATVLVGMKL